KRQVPAQDQRDLEDDQQKARRVSDAARTEGEPRDDQLDEVVEQDAEPRKPPGGEMQGPAQGIRDRLGLVVIVETGEVAPAGIAPELDQSRPQHDPEGEPAEEPEDRQRGRTPGERTRVQERAEEDGEKAGLEKLDLPAVAVPVLSDPDERHV